MIGKSSFEKILSEYDEKRLKSAKELKARRNAIENSVPGLKEIEDDITTTSAALAIGRLNNPTQAETIAVRLRTLREDKQKLLAQYGYSVDDLSLSHECRKCQDTGYVGNTMCSCLRDRITDVLYDQSNIRSILEKENFNTFSFKYFAVGQPLSVAEQAVQAAHCFIDNFASSADNLFICGNTGVGKTFLTNCIAKELIDQGYFVVYLSAIKLFDILSDATFGFSKHESEEASITKKTKDLYSCDLLIIDDLGTELINSFTSTQLFNCINERLLAGKHTIISTNLSLSQLQSNYSERVSSRIASGYTLIKLLGDDIRMKKKLED